MRLSWRLASHSTQPQSYIGANNRAVYNTKNKMCFTQEASYNVNKILTVTLIQALLI